MINISTTEITFILFFIFLLKSVIFVANLTNHLIITANSTGTISYQLPSNVVIALS